MLVMIPFAVDELVAMGQYLRHAHRTGQSTWRLFFTGGPMEGGKEDQETDLASLKAALMQAVRGVTLIIAMAEAARPLRLLNLPAGLWLVAAQPAPLRPVGPLGCLRL
ncbi:MAG: hypothetical protein ACT4P4_08570 [Betaproteobacteria bacterium]